MTWTLAVVAAVILGYAMVSRRLDGTIITPAIVFLGAGLALGPDGLGLIDLDRGGHTVRLIAEATLALVLFSDASRIDMAALRREVTVPARLLGIGLPLTIVAGTLTAAALLDVLTIAEAAVLAIVLAPTDAALGQAVVTEERLPSRVSQGLNVESGLNDGICVPLLFIALAAAEVDASRMTAAGAAQLVVEEIGYGIVGGLVGGAAAAVALLTAGRRGWIGPGGCRSSHPPERRSPTGSPWGSAAPGSSPHSSAGARTACCAGASRARTSSCWKRPAASSTR